ncbi:cytochrome b [Vreelandella alkaliphila]|uniref:Cytochrome B n=1 Tax=Halomonas campaniensis TaxID=213554 RepID=A0A3D0KJC9_9GAMM|nr:MULTISPECIES: cytochrome b [unclassified Halomonas]HBS82761.1 cytochrome B [Halomonas campaniensis]HCA03614.1 cytochrome B [Halomonas campaniensis]
MVKGTANNTVLNSDSINTPAQTHIGWLDSPNCYGRISRALHWVTAALITLQFTVLLAWRGMGENAITLFLAGIGPHGTLGFMILIVTLARLGWALANRKQRPPHQSGLGGRLARLVHITFYALLLWLPAFAIVRQYGRGGALRFYGMKLLPEAERDITWMIAPADLLHGPLSWLLCGLVIGHIAMALVHRFWLKDRVLARMVGAN